MPDSVAFGLTLPQLQVILQSISSLAIAGGFFYAAVQFRQARQAAHVTNFIRLVELQNQLRRMRVDNPALARVHPRDIEHLSTDQEIREYFLNLMQLGVFEIAWFSYKHGQIPKDYFLSWERRMSALQEEESFQQMIDNPSMKIMHDEFQRYVMSKMPPRQSSGATRSGSPPPAGGAPSGSDAPSATRA
ncbi:MAG: DUF6082 family protein [Planctomycetota bacterium]|nr:DUF6082 family protein [Planctomycetota bacterium]